MVAINEHSYGICVVEIVFVALASASCGSRADHESAGQNASALTECDFDVPGYTDYWVSPNGTDEAHSLTELHASLPQPLKANVYVHVRGGVYHDAKLDWTKLSSSHNIVIEGCPDEDAIFDGIVDGTPSSRLVSLEPSVSGNTNVTFRNLTIRNYSGNGIVLNGASHSGDDKCNRPSTGNNVVEHCTFENLGNAQWPSEGYGFAGVNVTTSHHNDIRDNSFSRLENVKNASSHHTLIHGVYAAHCSKGNMISSNSFDLISGDPIKFRDRSSNNIVTQNYFNRSGANSLINVDYNSGEQGSTDILVSANVATFPHKGADTDPLLLCRVDGERCTDEITWEHNVLELGTPASEEVAAITSGDFDQDGVEEVVVAFNYDDNYTGFTKVVSTAGSLGNRKLHRVLYANGGAGTGFWNVAAMTAGDFDDDGTPELLTGFHASSQTAVYRGDGASYLSGATSAGSIYSDTSGSLWRVAGLAAADFDESGVDGLITALQKSNSTAIYLGNGVNSVTNGGTLFTDSTSPYWRITAMSSGDFDNDDDYEVITAMHHAELSAEYEIYSGNGASSMTSVALHTDTSSPYWEITATVGGDFNGDGADELVTGMFAASSNTYELYRGNGTSSVASETLLSDSAPYYVRALGAADLDGGGVHTLVTAIERPGGTGDDLEIVLGNGTTDYDDLGILYSSYFNDD